MSRYYQKQSVDELLLETTRYFKAKKAYAWVDWEIIRDKYENIREACVKYTQTERQCRM